MSEFAASSEPAAVATLVAARGRFLAFVERKVGDRAVAEDILQQAFVRGLERIDQVQDTESVVAWFYRMLRNAVIDHQRRQGTKTRALDALAVERVEDETLADDRARVCACLGGLADALPPDHALAIRRIDLEGVAVKDFATEQGITANLAGVRLFRARERLRRAVVECCGACAEHGCVDCRCHPSAAL